MDTLPLEIFLLIAQPVLGAVCSEFHKILSLNENQRHIIKLYTNDAEIINSNKPFYIRFFIAKASRPGWLKHILNSLPPTRIRRILDQSLSITKGSNKTLTIQYITKQIPELTGIKDQLWSSIESGLPNPGILEYWTMIGQVLHRDYVKQVPIDLKNQKQRNIQTLIHGLAGPARDIFKFCINRSLQNYIAQPARTARISRVKDIALYLEISDSQREALTV